ncbi:hypothetical protein GALMADRAFT_138743 [Galerina marginata CBS 339.88]|uniref:Uncharacterized protein n=1 Tax=Galerina marginata (strain CBS 339.88) TaxID=685588 RepID=A0A067T5P1_GALM3|nr:hypothetical protein GALMADRAFT_138743 [Galerina marginata CBS 339.88]
MSAEDTLWTSGTPESNKRWTGGVQFSPDGSTLVYTKEGEVFIVDVRSRAIVESFKIDKLFAHAVKFSPNGQIFATGSSGGQVYGFSLTDRRLIFQLEGHTTYVRALSFSPDAKTLFSGSQDGTVRIWDVETGDLVKIVSLESGGNRTSYLRTIAITPVGGSIAAGWWDQAIRISDLSTGKLLHCIRTSGIPERLDFSPDGSLCTAALDSGTLLHIRNLTGEQPEIFNYSGHKLPDRVESMVNRTIVSKDGKWVISGSMASAVHFTRPFTRSANFVMKGISWDFDYHPESGIFAGALVDGTVRVWKFDPSVKNHPSRPPTPVRPAYSMNEDYDSELEFDDPYPWKD